MCTPPGWDLVRAFGKLPLLDELDLANVISIFDEDITASGPWGDDVERKPGSRTGIDISKLAIRILDPLSWSICRRMVRDDMVTESASFCNRSVEDFQPHRPEPYHPS